MQFICQNISFKDNNKLLNYITYKIGNLKKYFYFLLFVAVCYYNCGKIWHYFDKNMKMDIIYD